MSSLVWIELDPDAAAGNVAELRSCSEDGRLFCAVVKSNAYGHGVAEMTGLLDEADWFAVNSLDEGLELRGLGVCRPILLLGHVPLERLGEAVEADLRLTVYNHQTLDCLQESASEASPARVHVKVETGTWRQGVLPEDLVEFVRRAESIPSIMLEGISTHFANIEDTLNHSYAQRQLSVFTEALGSIRELTSEELIVHTACTAATILFPETHFDMLRAGIGLYGLWPSRETYLSAMMNGREVPDLRPVMTWKTRVAQIKEVPAGSFIGYGCTYRVTRSTRLAVLPVGYGDGYDRSLGNNAYVLVDGKRAPLLGRVCMNLIMVDITDIQNVQLEDEVVLLGSNGAEEITAEQMADWAGTINYEIVTRISPFLPRKIVVGPGEGES